MSQATSSIASSSTVSKLAGTLSRRDFVRGGTVVATGLVIGIGLTGCKPGNEPAREMKTIEANAWLRIGTDDSITFLCDRSEMGQGVFTALPMLLAEELGVAVDRIKVEFDDAATAAEALGVPVRVVLERAARLGAEIDGPTDPPTP